jgi:hypothetical protein
MFAAPVRLLRHPHEPVFVSKISTRDDLLVPAITPTVPCSFAVGIGFGPANHGEPPETPAGHIFDCTQDVLLPIARSPKEGHLASFRPRARIIYAEFALPVGNQRRSARASRGAGRRWRGCAQSAASSLRCGPSPDLGVALPNGLRQRGVAVDDAFIELGKVE